MSLVIDHPQAGASWTIIEFNNGVSNTIIVVETSLRLNTGDPDYDENLVVDFLKEAVLQINDQGYGANLIRIQEMNR